MCHTATKCASLTDTSTSLPSQQYSQLTPTFFFFSFGEYLWVNTHTYAPAMFSFSLFGQFVRIMCEQTWHELRVLSVLLASDKKKKPSFFPGHGMWIWISMNHSFPVSAWVCVLKFTPHMCTGVRECMCVCLCETSLGGWIAVCNSVNSQRS